MSNRIVLISFIIGMISFMVSCTTFTATKGHERLGGNNKGVYEKNAENFSEEKSLEAAAVNKLVIKTDVDKINIIENTDSTFKAVLHGKTTKDISKHLIFDVKKDGDTIYAEVRDKRKTIIISGYRDLVMDVYIPAGYSGYLETESDTGAINIEGVKAKNTSAITDTGKIKLLGIASDKVFAHANTGAVEAENITAKNITFETDTGRVFAKNINGENVSTKTDTGSTVVHDITCSQWNHDSETGAFEVIRGKFEKLVFDIDTGRVDISDSSGSIEGGTNTGSIAADMNTFNGNINLKSDTGRVTVKVPAQSEFAFDGVSATGKISCQFPITISGTNGADRGKLKGVVGKGGYEIKVKTEIGRIDIETR